MSRKHRDPWERPPEKPEAPHPRNAKGEDRAPEQKTGGLDPEPCPWCGGDMERGFLYTSRDPIFWEAGAWRFDLARWLVGGGVRVDDEGGLMSRHRTAWLCRKCGKLVLDAPEDLRAAHDEETEKEEESGSEAH